MADLVCEKTGISIGSNEIYDRMCSDEWRSGSNNEIHNIVYCMLMKMSYYIASKRFAWVPGLHWTDIAGDALVFMLKKGTEIYRTNESLKHQPPALRNGYVYRMLFNSMTSIVRAHMRANGYVDESAQEQTPSDGAAPQEKKRRTKRRRIPGSIDEEVVDGISIVDTIPDGERSFIEDMIDRIDADERRKKVWKMFAFFFAQRKVKPEKLLVSAMFWGNRAARENYGEKGFGIEIAGQASGKSLFDLCDMAQRALESIDGLEIPPVVMIPMRNRLIEEDENGRPAGERVIRIGAGQVAHWANERKDGLERWNDLEQAFHFREVGPKGAKKKTDE